MSDLDEIVDIQIALSDTAPSASSGGGGGGGGSPSLHVPTLAVQSTALDGDSVTAVVTVDDTDGFTTTSVTLLNGASLLGSATNGGGGNWSFTIVGITAGSYSLIGHRVTASGTADSTPHSLVVSPTGTPGVIQTKTGVGTLQANTSSGKATVNL